MLLSYCFYMILILTDFIIQLDDVIDLVIPRGSNRLVSEIKNSTKIPVLGHAGKIFNLYHQHPRCDWFYIANISKKELLVMLDSLVSRWNMPYLC